MAQIEQGERQLMEGVNFEFICHHPDDLVEDILSDFIDFMGKQQQQGHSYQYNDGEIETSTTTRASCESPRGIEGLTAENQRHFYSNSASEQAEDMMENVMDTVNQTLIFSDAPFLFSPEAIAYAVCCIETQSFDKTQEGYHRYQMGNNMRSYLVARHSYKTQEETLRLAEQVGSVITCLLNCPDLDLLPGKSRAGNVIAQRAEDLRRVLVQVADMRLLYKMTQVTTSRGGRSCYYSRKRPVHGHGTGRSSSGQQYGYTPAFGPPAAIAAARYYQQQHIARKMARITPTNENTGIIY
jgi:hypothetical protein